jgi:hypothetical protein
MHEPLSQKLALILKGRRACEGGITLNQLLERTEGRGFYLVIILLSLPFVVPVSIPGMSTILGLAIAVLTLRLALGRRACLPKCIGDRKLSAEFCDRILGGSVKFLRFVEKGVKPRQTRWLAARWAIGANALLMTFLGLLLALPFPPFPPFTNALPCYSLILVAASTMEEDGLMIWAGYGVSLGTTVYLFLVGKGLKIAIVKLIEHWTQ